MAKYRFARIGPILCCIAILAISTFSEAITSEQEEALKKLERLCSGPSPLIDPEVCKEKQREILEIGMKETKHRPLL